MISSEDDKNVTNDVLELLFGLIKYNHIFKHRSNKIREKLEEYFVDKISEEEFLINEWNSLDRFIVKYFSSQINITRLLPQILTNSLRKIFIISYVLFDIMEKCYGNNYIIRDTTAYTNLSQIIINAQINTNKTICGDS